MTSGFLDFSNGIIAKYGGASRLFDAAPMVFPAERDGQEPGTFAGDTYVTNFYKIRHLTEENHLYRQNLTFLTQLMEKRFYQNLYPTVERQVEGAVRAELPALEERTVRELTTRLETLVREVGVRELSVLRERMEGDAARTGPDSEKARTSGTSETEKSEAQPEERLRRMFEDAAGLSPASRVILLRKIENIYNSTLHADMRTTVYEGGQRNILYPGTVRNISSSARTAGREAESGALRQDADFPLAEEVSRRAGFWPVGSADPAVRERAGELTHLPAEAETGREEDLTRLEAKAIEAAERAVRLSGTPEPGRPQEAQPAHPSAEEAARVGRLLEESGETGKTTVRRGVYVPPETLTETTGAPLVRPEAMLSGQAGSVEGNVPVARMTYAEPPLTDRPGAAAGIVPGASPLPGQPESAAENVPGMPLTHIPSLLPAQPGAAAENLSAAQADPVSLSQPGSSGSAAGHASGAPLLSAAAFLPGQAESAAENKPAAPMTHVAPPLPGRPENAAGRTPGAPLLPAAASPLPGKAENAPGHIPGKSMPPANSSPSGPSENAAGNLSATPMTHAAAPFSGQPGTAAGSVPGASASVTHAASLLPGQPTIPAGQAIVTFRPGQQESAAAHAPDTPRLHAAASALSGQAENAPGHMPGKSMVPAASSPSDPSGNAAGNLSAASMTHAAVTFAAGSVPGASASMTYAAPSLPGQPMIPTGQTSALSRPGQLEGTAGYAPGAPLLHAAASPLPGQAEAMTGNTAGMSMTPAASSPSGPPGNDAGNLPAAAMTYAKTPFSGQQASSAGNIPAVPMTHAASPQIAIGNTGASAARAGDAPVLGQRASGPLFERITARAAAIPSADRIPSASMAHRTLASGGLPDGVLPAAPQSGWSGNPASMVYEESRENETSGTDSRKLRRRLQEITEEIREVRTTTVRQETLEKSQQEAVKKALRTNPAILTESGATSYVARQVQSVVEQQLEESVSQMAGQVYRRLEQKLRTERERRGLI
ncbi:MAG: hypothetical protein Q4C82_06040 [Eubacteriales bacterium]|nr:hypothetical protein [Eubacteriales bacterium]